jgi:hypothetical protein
MMVVLGFQLDIDSLSIIVGLVTFGVFIGTLPVTIGRAIGNCFG